MTLPSLTERAAATSEDGMGPISDGRLSRRALARRGGFATVLMLSALLPAAVLKAQQPTAPESPDNGAQAPSARDPRSGREARSLPASRPSGAPQAGRPASPAPRFVSGRGSGFGAAAAPSLGEGPTCTLDATIYDVRLPADQIGRLDVDALEKASETAEAFEKALSALGTIRPLYRASQSVRLSGDTINIGSEMPMITSSRETDKGQTVNTIQYRSTGAIFTLAGRADASGAMDLDLSIQVSAASEGGTPITDKVKAPVMRKASLSHKGPAQARKPFVVISVDAGSTDKDGKAVAYIGRIKMGEPQSYGTPK